MFTATIILIVILLILVGGGWYLYLCIRKHLRRFSREAFGVDSIAQGISIQQDLLANTPKSVSGMTSLCLPQIMKDFPEFSLPEYIHKAENLIRAVLSSIEAQDMQLLQDASPDLKKQIQMKLEDQIRSGLREHFQDVQIHQTEVLRYKKLEGSCVIKLQSSVSYLYLQEQKQMPVGQQKKIQTLYETDLMYVQDSSLLSEYATAATVVCPQCGAPVKNMGAKSCEYCGSAVEPVNLRVWQFVKVAEK